MDDADATQPGQGDGHRRFGNGIHCRGDDGNVEPDVADKPRAQVGRRRQHLGVARGQQHVVEGQGQIAIFVRELHDLLLRYALLKGQGGGGAGKQG